MNAAIQLRLGVTAESARLHGLFNNEGDRPTLLKHLAMLRAFEADNVGRMHQVAALMIGTEYAALHPTITQILAVPEDDTAVVEIFGGEAVWAISKKNGERWDTTIGPADLPFLRHMDLKDTHLVLDGSVELAIVHLTTGVPEYFWTKQDGAEPWFRWTEAPIAV